MSWEGYFEIDQAEIINVARTEAYCEGIRWFRPVYKNEALPSLIGHDPYVDPEADQAPWFDPRIPQSAEFMGVYPLDVAGLDDSTLAGSMVQSLGNGGSSGGTRRATKGVVFNVALLAISEAGAAYGAQWLGRALLGPMRAQQSFDGYDLSFFASEPHTGVWGGACDLRRPMPTDLYEVADLLGRTMRGTQVASGLTISSRRRTSDDGAIWTGSFTLESKHAFQFGWEIPFLEGWLDPETPDPWPMGSAPAGASVLTVGVVDEVACLSSVNTPIYDPLCPAVIPPPNPPGIAWGCYLPPETWNRSAAVVPATFIPGWGDVVPIIRLAATEEVRNVRVRIYPDPTNLGVVEDECSFVADFAITWIPQGSILTIDTADEMVYMDSPEAVRRRADSLVFSSDAGPFKWPALTGGVNHLITVDVDPIQSTEPVIDVSLIERFG